MTYKCKICGGTIVANPEEGVFVCQYCGTKQTMPLFQDDSSRLLFESGTHYLRQSEYDKAEGVFNQLLAINPRNPDLHWNLVLCKYGVTFVRDTKTAKYIPTCNRTYFESVLQDENYQKALSFANDARKAYYTETAAIIDNIQKGIISVFKKEKPFDIFISYKETTPNGSRTKDSVQAQKLYDKLTEAGYKVFFSRITLEKKIGTEYEPYIYAALQSSKVMVTVCSCKENIEAPWVKNEWGRFLTLRQKDSSKTIIPLYFDMDAAEMPGEFALFASYDMMQEGFEQEFLRGIKKLIPTPITAKQRRRNTVLALTSVTAVCCAAILLYSTWLAPKIEAARVERETPKMYQSALDFHQAGRLDEAISLLEQLGDYKDSLALSQQYKAEKAVEDKYQQAIRSRDSFDYDTAIQLLEELGNYKDSVDILNDMQGGGMEYDAAMKLYRNGRYPQAAWAFGALGDYRDAQQMQKTCEESWRKSVARITDSARYGNFFVSANGDLQSVKEYSQEFTTELTANEHGKIVSLSTSQYALHDDGYLQVSWGETPYPDGNVIKISGDLKGINLVLLADGTMNCFGGSVFEELDSAMAQVKQWSNIVDFYTFHNFGSSMGGFTEACVVGICADGTLKHAFYSELNLNYFLYTQEFFSQIHNAKAVQVTVPEFEDDVCVIRVLTTDEQIITFEGGDVKTEKVKNVRNFYYDRVLYLLQDDGKLTANGTVILEDVAYIQERYAVTQSGTIYTFSADKAEPMDFKTRVHDQWSVMNLTVSDSE